MLIQDAIKSGKPFRRKDANRQWLTAYCVFSSGDVLSEEWEIQEKTITITESQFDEAWDKNIEIKFNCYTRINSEPVSNFSGSTNDLRDRVKKELGF